MAFLKISMKLELESCSWLQSRFVMVALSQNELPLKIQFRRPIDLPPSLSLSLEVESQKQICKYFWSHVRPYLLGPKL